LPTLIHEKVRDCQTGNYPKTICRVNSGWVVLGDVQFLRGYCLLLPDPVVADLNQLEPAGRREFLYEMSLVGDVLLELTDAVRVNYEMLGNLEPALHAHIFPRYDSEPEQLRTKPVWLYDWEAAPAFDIERDAMLMQEIRDGICARL